MAASDNTILLATDHKGVFLEGIISGTDKPGTIMEIKNTALVGGRPTWQAFSGTDGNPALIAVLLEDALQGKTVSDAYVTATRCFLYAPAAGEEINVLVKDITGTGSGDEFNIGDYGEVDGGTGKVIKISGSPTSKPFVFMEAITDVTADKLAHVMYTGH